MHPSIKTIFSHNGSRWYQRIVLAGIPIGLFFGTWGYIIYGEGKMSLLTAFYHTIQLFAFHMPHLEGHINWQLELGRWAAAATTGLMGVLLLRRTIVTEWRHIQLSWAKKHVVICGLGEVGKRLALEFSRAGSKVVAVEREATAPGAAEVESKGIPVVIGDAKDPDTLRKVRAHHAANVFAVCSDDDTNIAITVAVRDLAKAGKSASSGAECLLLLADPVLREKVTPYLTSENETGGFRIRVGGFDMSDMAARLAFEEHPLDFDGIREKDTAKVHLVIVGTCQLSEALAVKALQLCHFANRSRLQVSVVGKDAQGFIDRLRKKHYAEPWYEAHAVECNHSNSALHEKVAALPASDELVTVAICPGSENEGDVESQNVLLAMTIKNALCMVKNPARRTQILVYLRRKSGFSTLFGSMNKSDEGVSIHAFGLIETLYSSDTLLHEKQDAVAMALNEDYRRRHGGDEWSKLPEEFRDSNRLAADHIPVKLRAIGLRIADKGEGEPVDMTVFKKPDDENTPPDPVLVLMAEMEHSRECAERWLLGWRFGEPKDREERMRLKINRNLVSWAKLDYEERKKDWEQIRAIPDALGKVGKMIVRGKP